MNLEERLGKLDALGSPDQIADFFEREGIVGRPGAASQCPVARWLTAQQTETFYGVNRAVTSQYVTKAVECGFETDMVECCENPKSVGEFVRCFDKGQYPQLEEH